MLGGDLITQYLSDSPVVPSSWDEEHRTASYIESGMTVQTFLELATILRNQRDQGQCGSHLVGLVTGKLASCRWTALTVLPETKELDKETECLVIAKRERSFQIDLV